MKVINIMLASGKGGLEQMSTVYTRALTEKGIKTTSVLINDSPYKDDVYEVGANLKIVNSRHRYSLLSTFKIFKIIKREKADLVICHGNRPMAIILNNFAKFIFKTNFKTIGVMHSKKCPHKYKCDNLIFLTKSFLKNEPKEIQNKSFTLPNTILEDSHQGVKTHTPITFGAMGRLHTIKGFDILLESLAIIKNKGYKFKLVLGGDGPEKENLLQQIKDLNLEKEVEYMSWISNKKEFFDKIDVFCLSSRSERMPLTVLESFAYSKAIISTNLEGPKEVLSDISNPLIAELENPYSFAEKLEFLINNPEQIELLAKQGNDIFNEKYKFDKFKENLSEILKQIA